MRRRNSDDRLRALERVARQTGATSDAVAWWRGLVQAGEDPRDATHVVDRSGVVQLHELMPELVSQGLVDPSLVIATAGSALSGLVEETSEAVRRVYRREPPGAPTWCETNDCEEPTCHRCFTRDGCTDHEKCVDFARRGVAEFVAARDADVAERWLMLRLALAGVLDELPDGPDLPVIAEDEPGVSLFMSAQREAWMEWAREQDVDDARMSRKRAQRVAELLWMAVESVWDCLDYLAAVRLADEVKETIDRASDDALECSRCARTAFDYGTHACGSCGQKFCVLCQDEGGAHGGHHQCADVDRCAEPGCDNELDPRKEGDYCDEHSEDGAETAENPYWGRAGAGLMLFSSDMRRVLLALRSDEVEEPGTWGVPGGKLKPGESPYDGAIRETREELGPVPPHVVFDEVVFEDGDFRYTTHMARLDPSADGWLPDLDDINWESDEVAWFNVDRLPDDLHFGVEHIIGERPRLFQMNRRSMRP